MTLLPGWDSSEFVRTAHRDLEFVSIIGFVICAGCEFIKHIRPSHGKLVEWLVIGSFLFAAFMELIAFPYGERNDELAREQASKQEFAISELGTKAQEALGRAKKAIDDSDSAALKAASAEESSDRATGKSGQALALARAARAEADSFERNMRAVQKDATRLSATVAAQGPRWLIISKLTPKLVEELKEFKGQRCLISYCIKQFENDPELETTAGAIWQALRKAEWNVSTDTYNGCLGASPSLEIMVHVLANKDTGRAADILGGRLMPALNVSGFGPIETVHGDFRRWTNANDGSILPIAPWEAPLIDDSRNAIVVLVSKHP